MAISRRKILIYQKMQRVEEENQLQLSKLYREFTRRKFAKYKLQFPRLRESELIHKIIREWEALSLEEKHELQANYVEGSGDAFLKDSKSKSKSGSVASAAKGEKTKKITKKKTSPKVRIFVEKKAKREDIEQDSDIIRDDNSDKLGVANSDASSQSAMQARENIKKSRANQNYLNFYKYYYNRLASEHPRWSSSQVTTIIKLLWKKRKINPSHKRVDAHKPISGKMKYLREKRQAGEADFIIKRNWKELPHESKVYWEIKGRGGLKPRVKPGFHVRLRKMFKSGRSLSEESRNFPQALNWMRGAMGRQ